LLADGRPKTRLALRVLLERQPLIAVVGEAADGEGLLALAMEMGPDVVLMDWDLSGNGSAGWLSRLRKLSPDSRIIVLSGKPETRQSALSAGADAFVSKTDPPECLLGAIERVASEGFFSV